MIDPLTSNGNNDDDDVDRLSRLNENGIDAEIQVIIDQQEIINQTLAQLFPSRVVSVSDSELECELANLIYGHPEKDYVETPVVPVANTSADS